MTDQERARAFSNRFSGNAGPLLATDEESGLAEEFAAVRLEERRAIVRYLRSRRDDAEEVWSAVEGNRNSITIAILDTEASRIDRGEHGS